MSSASTYALLDSGNFRKLEKIGSCRVIRPAAQASWRPGLHASEWQEADFEFLRRGSQDGIWQALQGKKAPSLQTIDFHDLQLELRLTDFGHIGLFPEHASQWPFITDSVAALAYTNRAAKVLNLFAYTGAMSLHAAKCGAEVVHVDASRTSVDWAKRNAVLSQLSQAPIRWIMDDVCKFTKREIRRESKYDAIILDPPSFGRGPKGELWKIEDHLPELLGDLAQLLNPEQGAILLSCHTPGYTPLALSNLLSQTFGKGKIMADELRVDSDKLGNFPLPSGCFARLTLGGKI
jgi:23S rRNA (cytosine1962-C5)-methyltransferase